MTDPLLELRDVEAGYGETQVLDGVSLDVQRGETVSLIGRNGVGKTTTLRSILGAVTPTGGQITYDGEDVTALDPVETARRGIGLVPEERRVFPGLSVEENLRIGSYGGSDTPNRRSVDEVLDTFENLSRRRESRGVDLSGGEQQMLSIGRALVAGADLLMLDEPTEGLAPLIVDRVADLAEEINDEGITVLLVEQNVSVALELADRVYILDKGDVVYEGTPAELDDDESILDRYLGVSV
jgi:branched-chain amino acid transport system ATP-binding protein